jgi:hypothetical protein
VFDKRAGSGPRFAAEKRLYHQGSQIMTHASSPTDPFRIGLTLGCGPNTPPSPAPVSPATSWYDVYNWQSFLLSKSFLTGSVYPDNLFDAPTQMATKAFQLSAQYGPVLQPTGMVIPTTYNKAVAAGMPAYPQVPMS